MSTELENTIFRQTGVIIITHDSKGREVEVLVTNQDLDNYYAEDPTGLILTAAFDIPIKKQHYLLTPGQKARLAVLRKISRHILYKLTPEGVYQQVRTLKEAFTMPEERIQTMGKLSDEEMKIVRKAKQPFLPLLRSL